MNLDAVGNASLLEVAPRFVSILATAVSIVDLSVFADGFCPPDGGVADRRAHLEDGLRIHDSRVLVEEASNRRANNRDIAFPGLAFHLLQDGLALGQHRIEIVLDAFICDWHRVLFPSAQRLAWPQLQHL